MQAEAVNFKITPSVVEADQETELQIISRDGIFQFYDDVEYSVEFIPMEESDVPMDAKMSLLGWDSNRKSYKAHPENGVLHIRYFFRGEQEWRIHISAEDYKDHTNPLYQKYEPHWHGLLTAHKTGITLSVYSLKPDLYRRRALRGDLHIHTYRSDGDNSPALTATQYRKAGYDFIALTDHNVFDSARYAKEKLPLKTNFEIMRAEEVHNGIPGLFHMVNIGGEYSINEMYLNNPEKIEQEAMALDGEIEIPEGLDKREYLNRVWLYRAIKKSGGYVIYPHPYWEIANHYHTETKMSRAIIENKLCDAYEILGGCTREGNHLQVELYNQLRAEGLRIPIVGSTDTHSTFRENPYFKSASTIAFCEDRDPLRAISEGYSVAVEHPEGESVRIYGEFRLVKYAYFLWRTYFSMHNELCFASGKLMECYVLGNPSLKEAIEKTEETISELEEAFFPAK